jgi:PAS domain S-box-containing protein
MELLSALFGRGDYLPHGICFTWTPGLLWAMVVSDASIAAAYFSIPLAIAVFTRKRSDVSWKGIAWLFSAFIFACGVTHLLGIWTIWQPDYGVQALAKALTAIISVLTAVALWRLIPKALTIPSVEQLQRVIAELEREVQMRQTAEGRLAELQRSLSITLDSIGAGFIAADRAGRVTLMNGVAEELTGWPAAVAQGQSIWVVFDREGRPASFVKLNPVDIMIEQGVTADKAQLVTVVARDGRRTAVEVRAALTHAEDGTVRGLAMVFRDRTQLVRAEAESNRLAAIVESSLDAIIGKTLDGRITSWNGAAQAMFGYSANEALGQPVQMLIPADRQAEEMHILAELARGRRVPAFDTVRQAKGGALLQVSVTISPIHDGLGRIVGASKIARDVTLQRRAEAALRDSDARLRFTLESARIGDWDLDLASGESRRSPQHDRCFGYDVPQPQWRFEDFLRHVHDDDRAEVEQGFHAAVAGLQDWRADCRVVWPDSTPHWISLHGSLRLEGGRPARMLGIVTDITEQRQAEALRLKAQRLEAENRQITDANRVKSQFLANMSHELRTPLNAVIGFADLLHTGAVPTDSLKHKLFLGHIATSGRHLLQLINDVLDLSKVESGRFDFYPEPVQLPMLVAEVRDILETAIQRKKLVFSADIDAALDGLVLDPARLKQVLYNYLSNAIKFTPDGGHVGVRAFAEGRNHFRLEVHDNGIGIAEADLPRLFTEFQQLDAGHGKLHQGTGLGLALTRRLVQAQGGTVGVRSASGMGSVFYLVLGRVPAAGLAEAPGHAAAGHRMLVIQDEQPERARLLQGLEAAGFSVDVAADGEHALRQTQDLAYDAITLGLRLSGQPGLGVLAGIRGLGASSRSPVVGVSMPGGEGEAAAFHIANVLSKPLLSEEVVAAMAGLRRAGPGRARVMVVDDDPLALALMSAALAAVGVDAVCVPGGRQALAEIGQHQPDAIILDLMMPEFDGFATLDALGRLQVWRDTPVFIWTSLLLTEEEYAQLSRSAQAILSKGGGGLAALLDGLRRWRPLTAPPAEASRR